MKAVDKQVKLEEGSAIFVPGGRGAWRRPLLPLCVSCYARMGLLISGAVAIASVQVRRDLGGEEREERTRAAIHFVGS